ncbi:MAG: exopolysaccharide biosynthesis polyprenyl glycosylphosphotransferase [Patescibacteria group bacterium]
MILFSNREYLYLLIGDIVILSTSLYLTLFLRHLEFPSNSLVIQHLLPFSILITLWLMVFFIAGLYEKQTLFFKAKLPETLFNTQATNTFLSVIFFYFIPSFGIEPKTNLFLYIAISSVLIFLWRIYGVRFLIISEKLNAILIGNGEEIVEVEKEVNSNSRYSIFFVSTISPENLNEEVLLKKIKSDVKKHDVSVIVTDLHNKKSEYLISHLYNSLFKQFHFLDINKLYEEIFDRIPVSSLNHSWFLENISSSTNTFYNVLKRMMDFFIASILGIISLLFYPFVYLAIKIDDGGQIFIMQERVGKNNSIIKTYKFRSMTQNITDLQQKGENKITRVGNFLRKSRIDELPQLWSIIKNDMSLIGPRPELPSGVKYYEGKIPYYNIRHLIKPGLSGWAQIYGRHAHHGIGVEETRNKLSYDLYYLKNQSLILDVKIALKTIRTLMSQSGA